MFKLSGQSAHGALMHIKEREVSRANGSGRFVGGRMNPPVTN
jgi:hypothetical protein